ncbi:unnamed protein product [Cladocopium goreaui]|uniref:Uncharacterized protein n=1 Tax=Cladocopium goreaui TaxID=2562237 RepID=A0A9P1BMN9_9DINO|nr:unnamed protein product [Cladocopium goreaui]
MATWATAATATSILLVGRPGNEFPCHEWWMLMVRHAAAYGAADSMWSAKQCPELYDSNGIWKGSLLVDGSLGF